MVTARPHLRALLRPRGFTLMEAMMASAILASAVVSVTWAITAGQQQAFEARRSISATLLAEKVMGELLAVDYDDLALQAGIQTQGNVHVWTEVVDPPVKNLTGVDVRVGGKELCIKIYSSDWTTVLAEVSHFAPEPGP